MRVATVVGLLCILSATTSAAGGQYRFTLIDSRGFGNWASINDRGVVAFDSQDSVYTSDGTHTTLLFTAGSVGDGATINHDGSVAFVAYTNMLGAWKADASSATQVYAPMPPGKWPWIDSAGDVAFVADRGFLRQGIGVWRAGTVTWVADAANNFAGVSDPALNDNGRVAFSAQPVGTESTIVYVAQVDRPGVLTRVIGTGDPIPDGDTVRYASGPLLDGRGDVFVQLMHLGGHVGLYRVPEGGGPPQALATTRGDFSAITTFSINDAGNIVFHASLHDGETGIFSGPDGDADRILMEGDQLFGKTVSQVGLGDEAMNDAGQIVFRVFTTDNEEWVVRADPIPEPGALVFTACALTLMSRRHGMNSDASASRGITTDAVDTA